MEVQGAMAGHSYTLRLYHNQSHGASGPGRAVTAVSVNPFPDPPTLARLRLLPPPRPREAMSVLQAGCWERVPWERIPLGWVTPAGGNLPPCDPRLVAGGRAAP